jgi:hypothetical protein
MLATLNSAIREWRRRQADLREFRALDERSRTDLANDMGLGVVTMETVIASGRGRLDLMKGVMRAAGVDPDAVDGRYPGAMRDLAITCSLCQSSRTCRRELAAGTAHESFDRYCPNAGTFRQLAG